MVDEAVAPSPVDAWERLSWLQRVTLALGEAITPQEVAAVVVEQGLGAMQAQAGSVMLLVEADEQLEVLASSGYPVSVVDQYQHIPVSASLPLADAVRKNRPIWLHSIREAATRYPHLDRDPLAARRMAAAAIPLSVRGRVIGALGLSFAGEQRFGEDDRSFVLVLAQHCAQALERARLYVAEQEARRRAEAVQQRLVFLAEASAVLAGSLDYEQTLQNVAHLALPELADWCFIDLHTEDGGVQRVAVECADPARQPLADALRRYPVRLAASAWETQVMLGGRAYHVAQIPPDAYSNTAWNDEHRDLLASLGIRSFIFAPLVARDRALGILVLAMADSGREYDPGAVALAEELARRAAVAVDNARLFRQTREALHVRDEFLSSVSHDLKTPLTTIKGFAQLIRRWVSRIDDPRRERILDGLTNIDAVTARMTAQVGELLDLTRLQTGRPLDLFRETTDLVALTRQAAADHQRTSGAHRVRVQTEREAIVGEWDAARLERVLSNLLSNAIKYSPDGGEVSVRMGVEQEGGRELVVLSVIDSGIGIPEQDLPHIFDRFYRGANAIGKMWGSGIGLTGARQLVEQHGGTISAANNPDGGATFTIRLPLDEQTASTQSTSAT